MNLRSENKPSRILVVDDDEMLNMLFCSFLESKELEPIPAHSVAAAKKILQSDNAIDLMLLDYQLGDGVGMDLLDENALTTYASRPPIIMISANEEPEFLERCFVGGVDDYIIKPVNLSLLALKVEALIETVSMQRVIVEQKIELEKFKHEAEREEQVAKFTYDYLLNQNSNSYSGVEVWLKSFAAFSGDITLVKKSPSGNLYVLLADATGHGLSAAITIMPIVTIFNDMVNKGFHTQQIVTELNRKLVSDTPADRFVASILIEINPYKQELNVWNGGMPPVYWIYQGQIKHEFNSTHMSLGILDDDVFDASVVTIDLPTAGFIFACSDGLLEQENSDGVAYSAQRVIYNIAKQPENILQNIAASLERHVGNLNYSDDVSVCTIEPRKVFKNVFIEAPITDVIQKKDVRKKVFSWQLTLAGQQLENCAIPPLCNQFLQQVDVDQQLCQKIFSVIAEMVSNALDHGVLGLNSEMKENPDGFFEYLEAREARLKLITENDFVKIVMEWQENGLWVEVEDSGKGYQPKENDGKNAPKFSGRGSKLIQQLSASVEVVAPGNKIRAFIK